jgi:hypothetical protein
VQVVVSEDAACVEALEESQGAERVWSAVDEVTRRVKLVSSRIKRDRLKELLELFATTLNVSDEDASLVAHSSSPA